jgi:small-conductance mechanosensitive channel
MSFDLKAAQEAMTRATERPNVTTDIYHLAALTYLPAALDEIERLQKEQATRLSELEAAYLKAQNSNLLRKQAYESLEKIASEQAKRIAELKATQKQLSELVTEKENVTIIVSQEDEVKSLKKKLVESNHRNLDLQCMVDSDTATITKQRAALKKLGKEKRERGKALVEERARGNHYGMSYEDASDGEIERWIIDGEIDAPKVYIERMRMESRAQLRREGKL